MANGTGTAQGVGEAVARAAQPPKTLGGGAGAGALVGTATAHGTPTPKGGADALPHRPHHRTYTVLS